MIKVEEISPYRKPWLMVDKVIEYKKFEMIITQKNISYSDYFIVGHFENKSIFPGVLLLEGIKQSSEILLNLSGISPVNYISRVVNTRFLSPVVPGDVVTFHINLSLEGDNMGISAIGNIDHLTVVRSKIEGEVVL